MKRFAVTFLKFMIVPVLVFAALELHARQSEARFWFDGAAREIRQQHADFLFVGTSRVAAALDSEEFSRAISKITGHPTHTINLGMGYSTAAEYYFGFQKLLKYDPDCLRGTTVLVEAPCDLPTFDTWQDDWLQFPEAAYQLGPYINWTDLLKYWSSPQAPLRNKWALTLAKCSAFLPREPMARAKLLSDLEDRTDKLFFKLSHAGSLDLPAGDLNSAGGIRSDPNGVLSARRQALTAAERSMDKQQRIEWDRTILNDLRKLVTANGGKLVFFEMPMSSVQAQPLQTPQRTQDEEAFRQIAATWGCPILRPAFTTQDSDFPDLWHLRRSRSAEFTDAVALSLIKQASIVPGSIQLSPTH